MRLPAHPKSGVQIGVSDILAWRDCAMRAKLGRRRLEGQEAPETWSPANAYGSAIHLCLERLDDGLTPDEAAQEALAQFKQWLEPSDLSRLHEDMEKYLARQMVGVRTLLNESEISVPLFEHPTAGPVWFRARIDRLYQSLDDPAVLFHVDFKSSKWAKSHEEVAADIQLWSYNWSIVEWFLDLFPEVERDDVRLLQTYDQLRYGEIPTQKGPAQRAEIKRWLIAAVTAMIADEEEAPTFNQWCPWCPLVLDCPVVQHQLTDWAATRIAALMPREERLNQDGSVSKRPGPVKLDPGRVGEYVELLPDITRGKTVLGRFEEEVRDLLKEMPDSTLASYGKRKRERKVRAFSTEAKRRVVEAVGIERALMLFDLSIASVERFFGDDASAAEEITALAESRPAYTVVEDA